MKRRKSFTAGGIPLLTRRRADRFFRSRRRRAQFLILTPPRAVFFGSSPRFAAHLFSIHRQPFPPFAAPPYPRPYGLNHFQLLKP